MVARGEPGFDGMVVNLGALGAVTRVTLDVEPAFDIVQRTYGLLPWAALLDQLNDILAACYSVSVLTTWGAVAERVWVKHRVDAGSDPGGGDLWDATYLEDDRDGPPTADLTAPGPSSNRLPHFTMDQTPSVGEELQAEYFVARRDAVGALQAVHDLSDVVQPVLHIAEIRTVAADQLWMSPQYEQDTLAIALIERLDPRGTFRNAWLETRVLGG